MDTRAGDEGRIIMLPPMKGEFRFELTFSRQDAIKVKSAALRLERHHGARYVIVDDNPDDLPMLRCIAALAAKRQVARIIMRYMAVSISGDSI